MPVKAARPLAHKSAARRSAPARGGRLLTTHVGSLVRPPRFREFLAAERDGQRYDEAAFKDCLHDSVAEVVRKQVEFGLDVVNDCECGKTISGSRYVLRRLSGFEQRGQREAGMPADRRPPSRLGRHRTCHEPLRALPRSDHPAARGTYPPCA
jgi:hypothetical protein